MQAVKLLRSAPVRYGIAFAVLSTLVMGALLAVIYWGMLSLLEQHLEQSIEDQIQVLRNDLAKDGREAMLELVHQHVQKQHDSPVHFLVQDSVGNVLAGDLPPMRAVEGWQQLSVSLSTKWRGNGQRTLRALGVMLDNNTFVLVAHDTKDLVESRELIVRSFGTALAVTAVLTLGGGLIIGVALLRRVDAASRAAATIMGGDLSHRIPVAGSGDEFDMLAKDLNRMLSRIEELMENLRHVSSDIAHDLRTPLGRLRQRLEACRIKQRSPAEYEAVVDAAIEDTDTILRTFDAMLRIAQIEAGASRSRFVNVDLGRVAENVVEAFSAVAEDDGKTLNAQIEAGVTVFGDRELLTQMLANIIENALRHTPTGTTVDVHVSGRLPGAMLIVSDDGAGIPANQRERVLGRFHRLDASRSTPGSGLGLSLVAAVAKLHDAKLVLEGNQPGLRVTVTFL
jgi:signal transduction histidine kinase